MSIAIVIPCYNAARYLTETLESVLAQSLADWSLVLVDDGSTDRTQEIAREHARRDSRILVMRQENQGVSSARNNGYAHAKASEHAIFLDADDLWEPDALQALSEALASDPAAPAANGLHRVIDAEGRLQEPSRATPYELDRYAVQGNRLVPWPKEQPASYAALAYNNFIMTPGTLLIRRRALDKIDLFDPSLTHAEDWDVWLRLSLLAPIKQIDRYVLRYRQHGTGASTSKERIHKGELAVRQKLAAMAGLSDQDRRIALLAARFAARGRSRDMLRWAGESLSAGRITSAVKQLRHCLLGYVSYIRGGL